MRNLLLLLMIAYTTSFGYGQGIPEKANTIIITLPDSNNVSEKAVKVFTNRDYPVQNSDKASTNISTGAKTLKNNTRVSMNAGIQGADIILTGRIVIAGQGSMPIEYKGNKGTPIMIAWEEMDKIAKAFGGRLKYEVK